MSLCESFIDELYNFGMHVNMCVIFFLSKPVFVDWLEEPSPAQFVDLVATDGPKAFQREFNQFNTQSQSHGQNRSKASSSTSTRPKSLVLPNIHQCRNILRMSRNRVVTNSKKWKKRALEVSKAHEATNTSCTVSCSVLPWFRLSMQCRTCSQWKKRK